METFVLWLGFIGAWLLFAGPIYQAALELQDEDIEMDRIRAAGRKVEKPADVSVWWWLLPPIKIHKEHRRQEEYERRILELLSHEDVEALVSFKSKATAWLYVAVGGLCIAAKETYELAHHSEWNGLVLFAAIVGMALLSILNLIVRLRQAGAIKRP